MTDTPEHIKEIQRRLWMAKTPEQRLLQFLEDNDAMYKAILKAKEYMNNQTSAEKQTSKK